MTCTSSTSASGSRTRRRPSSSTGRPTSAPSAARETSRSGRPELEGPVGPVGDQSRDPAVPHELLHSPLLVDSPDPDWDPEAQRLLGRTAMVQGDEVSVGRLDVTPGEAG